MSGKVKILVVDDARIMRVACEKALSPEFEVIAASDGREAWELLTDMPGIKVVITDLVMPKMDGFELLDKIRKSSSKNIAELPVVVMTASGDDDDIREKALSVGATDFISKPFHTLEIVTRARSLYKLNAQVSDLEQLLSYDPLTGLLTKEAFDEYGKREFAYAKRHHASIAVLSLQIDEFGAMRQCNTLDQIDDAVIKLADILKSVLRQEDVAAKAGAGQFEVLLKACEPDGPEKVAHRIVEALKEKEFTANTEILVNMGSSGEMVADMDSFDALVSLSREMMRAASRKGENQFVEAEQVNVDRRVKIPSINTYAVIKQIEKGNAPKITDKHVASAMYTSLPLLKEIQERFDIDMHELMLLMEGKAMEVFSE